MIIGFDPGRDKCGIAVVNNNQVLYNQVVDSEKSIEVIKDLISQYKPIKIVMGNQTTSKQWQKLLLDNLDFSVEIVLVDEKNSTLEARKKYWELYPPKGFNFFIPEGLRIPPRPVDDIVAIILVDRYINSQKIN